MKKLIIITILCFVGVMQIYAQDQKANDPDEQIIVNKEYDEDGNLIQYDSTYIHQWSSDSTINFSFGNGFPQMKDHSMIDSLLQQFGMSQHFGMSPFDDEDFFGQFGPALSDSMFFNPFDQQAQIQDFFNSPGFEQMQKRMQEQLEQLNKNTPGFENEEQRKEWEALIEKQRKEQEELMKKFRNSE